MRDLDQLYRDEGWGELAEKALGIRPRDVESQAREVALYAAKEISRLKEKLRRDNVEWNGHCEQYRIEAGEATARAEAALAESYEECAKIADTFLDHSDNEFDGVILKHRKGQKNLELAAAAAAGMSHASRKIAAAIRARGEKPTP